MTIENLKLKESITLIDKAKAIEYIASLHFATNEDGSVTYVPYYKELAQIEAVAKYFVDGVVFDEEDYIYDCVLANNDLYELILGFMETSYFEEIMTYALDIIEYRKKENLARIQNESINVLTYKLLQIAEKENEKLQDEIDTATKLNEWLEQQMEINAAIPPEVQKKFAENFDMDAVMDSLMKHYEGSATHKQNNDIVKASHKIKEQENKIVDLEKALAKERQKQSVANVLAGKK